ncbi:MAG: four helix bundle protein [Ignavibacteria bacterium GWB2_35_12]|nr:MAG: four helix bundle protein [Ignavibacteria bacterium GWA2_35_8]OGU39677.1 MAG: four helix bundle protein [Ignavibacteria bacterium GWB2_35_12]OGU96438.1 MAG: four helix bundle protein [Ignavibacteria bacterium RIFOXYA2_FULL_35_10]OGV23871.1 MAG: four helix bundle protein [Ignavibacteria bacterium RIFOXYC2_FULL_35_21]
MKDGSSSNIKDKSFDFALDIINLYKKLKENNEFILSKQLLRAGTSIGANVAEAGAAQSKKEFITKMSIASKEARETKYWLQLLKQSKIIKLDYAPFLTEIDGIISILTKIIKTSQMNLENKNNYKTQHSKLNT